VDCQGQHDERQTPSPVYALQQIYPCKRARLDYGRLASSFISLRHVDNHGVVVRAHLRELHIGLDAVRAQRRPGRRTVGETADESGRDWLGPRFRPFRIGTQFTLRKMTLVEYCVQSRREMPLRLAVNARMDDSSEGTAVGLVMTEQKLT
jgi:hypothetical protein